MLVGVAQRGVVVGRRSRELVRAIIAEAGFDPGHTHYDVPKPRTSFPQGHLTTGIAAGGLNGSTDPPINYWGGMPNTFKF